MTINKNEYRVLGCMSGTSLDGLDLALCNFSLFEGNWKFSILKAQTLKYSEEWSRKLSEATLISADALISLDREYGIHTAEIINTFLESADLKPEFIVSHGHTVFHNPKKGYSFQLGNGNDISTITTLPVIYDLRNKDISLGGQGAPLVPIGDKLLFKDFDACLNLGGFSNISYEKNEERLAFDLCPVNIILNEIANNQGRAYDPEGSIGRSGEIVPELLNDLNSLQYYTQSGPKSLGKEWLEKEFKACVSNYSIADTDILRTIYEHITYQISSFINNENIKEVLVTGG
ncbi:MAG: anhydro-N-acetylmuramic acid kinase, partial [Bacteroidales bacterium]|nr:anhydro-N-acetylmuramic acid kinase [Bacteroidales bacterium]